MLRASLSCTRQQGVLLVSCSHPGGDVNEAYTLVTSCYPARCHPTCCCWHPQVAEAASIVVNAEEPKYVCRGGLKLEGALRHFGIDVTGAYQAAFVAYSRPMSMSGHARTRPGSIQVGTGGPKDSPRHAVRHPYQQHDTHHCRVHPAGLAVLDSGQSTGGFTDCLLQHGASKVCDSCPRGGARSVPSRAAAPQPALS